MNIPRTQIQQIALRDILAERDRQDTKWGEQTHCADRWSNILHEEVGEYAKAVVEENISDQRHQIVEVAAVAMAIIEAMADGRYTETL